ncbi:MAG: CYTH domain-containing protein [Bacteroidales bacterium]
MAKEIERKFLVKGEFREFSVKETGITQAYLSVRPGMVVRLRISGNSAVFSIKAPVEKTEFTRHEWEFEIPGEMAREIMETCLPRRIIKTRYLVPFKGHTFEVDVFHGKNEGLIIAELELSDETEQFEKPEWLGEEVTGRPEYYNANLV